MELLQRIFECKEDEIDSIIESAIREANDSAVPVDYLGFNNGLNIKSVFKGFIPLKTRIKYASMNMEDYGMESTDFIYDFAHFLRDHNINSKGNLIQSLEYFVNDYFGYPGKAKRETIFNTIAWQTTSTDEEYFKALENNKLGDLKGKGAAQCTERGALVQQILNMFGIETYYCIGCVDLGTKQEAHCFNIAKTKSGYALLDYSVPSKVYNQDGTLRRYNPFLG